MSRKDLDGFYRRMTEDDNLKEKVQTLSGDVAALYAGMVKIAREAGFDITEDDIKASRIERQDMGDTELQSVAGGIGGGGPNCHYSCGPACGDYGGTWIGMQ